ncbi:hypothetical protein LX87_00359 [Larkinella arboricola]|uniref:PH (Pleckstrin Homology) domain-containing protein n=1 Tax=Larkinella arboricola TaxID=643671 RepID=A0A327X6E3_LARAB|nr:hypothetical protein [Larkinella arboricola]RAK02239.1 hypothetical protein LX87_00359 [Larkinella arboricola]
MYQEKQQFRQPWLWVLLIGVLGVTLYRQESVSIGIVVAVLGLFAFLRLETRIDDEGISYQWFPFQLRPRVINWHAIEQVSIRNYSALGEFGGWGIRFGWKATAHTVSGNASIEIQMKGKKRFLLIGTQCPDDVRQAIEQVKHTIA